jgi:hypothetical protein
LLAFLIPGRRETENVCRKHRKRSVRICLCNMLYLPANRAAKNRTSGIKKAAFINSLVLESKRSNQGRTIL